MYADNITGSMQRTIDETNRRRAKQLNYNDLNQITPMQITKSTHNLFDRSEEQKRIESAYAGQGKSDIAADPVVRYMGKSELEKAIDKSKTQMEKAAKELDFIEAARHRDEMYALQELLTKKEESN
jgi:excinuclease ABC subunit B